MDEEHNGPRLLGHGKNRKKGLDLLVGNSGRKMNSESSQIWYMSCIIGVSYCEAFFSSISLWDRVLSRTALKERALGRRVPDCFCIGCIFFIAWRALVEMPTVYSISKEKDSTIYKHCNIIG